MNKNNITLGLSNTLKHLLLNRFNWFTNKAGDNEIKRRISENVSLTGSTPWILIFAILTASIGLNINSPAVIIGAMLISPLMGPIMGAGLGVAIYDFSLFKHALLNLALATVISLVVSTLYFMISPLREAQSELLSRISPSIWDVLIALFGGFAGVIGITRKETSNVIPGVAIATALMPPVCTAGYGIATGQWNFVAGALYLYAINCVFICLSTIIGMRVLKLQRFSFENTKIEKKVKIILLLITLATAVPSAYLTVDLVRNEIFKSTVTKFIYTEFNNDETQVANLKINPDTRTVDIALIGSYVTPKTLDQIKSKLALSKLENTQIIIHQTNNSNIDISALKSGLFDDIYVNTQSILQKKESEITQLKSQLSSQDALSNSTNDIFNELNIQYPAIVSIFLGQGVKVTDENTNQKLIELNIYTNKNLRTEDKVRIENWFKVRVKSTNVIINFIHNK